VLLAPDERKAFHRYATAKTDSYGRYALKSVPPGDYRLFVFDSLEDGSYFEAGFLAGAEGSATPLNLGPSARESKDLTLRGTPGK
jgi:hypothetical protein